MAGELFPQVRKFNTINPEERTSFRVTKTELEQWLCIHIFQMVRDAIAGLVRSEPEKVRRGENQNFLGDHNQHN